MDVVIKDEAMRLVQALPDDFDWDDLMQAIYERIVIDRSRQDFLEGRTVSNEDARRRFLQER